MPALRSRSFFVSHSWSYGDAYGKDHDFTAADTGWGCLTNVTVLIEYSNPECSPEIAEYDMCAAIAQRNSNG